MVVWQDSQMFSSVGGEKKDLKSILNFTSNNHTVCVSHQIPELKHMYVPTIHSDASRLCPVHLLQQGQGV